MKRLLDEQIFEVSDGNNTSYLLKNLDMFYDIGFRVMKNQKSGSILDCHQLKYNGKIKFVFFTDGFTKLSDLLLRADADYVVSIIVNLIRAIDEIETNGFFNIACVDSRLDHIFVDNRTLSIRMIYIPINIPKNGMLKAEFENDIRTQLIRLIQGLPQVNSVELDSLINILRDGKILSLNEVGKYLHSDSIGIKILENERLNQSVYTYIGRENTNKKYNLSLVSTNGKGVISVTKDSFVIGKKKDKVDGVIDGNPAVSRVHCEIKVQGEKIWIKDNGSANGTYVNDKKLSAGQYVSINVNDRIRIANEEYIVRR